MIRFDGTAGGWPRINAWRQSTLRPLRPVQILARRTSWRGGGSSTEEYSDAFCFALLHTKSDRIFYHTSSGKYVGRWFVAS